MAVSILFTACAPVLVVSAEQLLECANRPLPFARRGRCSGCACAAIGCIRNTRFWKGLAVIPIPSAPRKSYFEPAVRKRSYNFDLAAHVAYRDGTIAGSWREAAHNAAGTISGHASGDRIVAAANGTNFAASLSLTTHGNRQSVAIRPQGTGVTGVSLTLSRQ